MDDLVPIPFNKEREGIADTFSGDERDYPLLTPSEPKHPLSQHDRIKPCVVNSFGATAKYLVHAYFESALRGHSNSNHLLSI
jgi:hypothetical protein